ncbi:hypothetical protein VARIO8X_60480 [Burkholderiales bacterium 8X]|nr:hypothetical protein VARIO8X_60480 [Burkholderiales bacterium 8X]
MCSPSARYSLFFHFNQLSITIYRIATKNEIWKLPIIQFV